MTLTQDILTQFPGLARLGYEVGADIDEETFPMLKTTAVRIELSAQQQAVEDLTGFIAYAQNKVDELIEQKTATEQTVLTLTAQLADLTENGV